MTDHQGEMATGPTVRQKSRGGVQVQTARSCQATKPSCATSRMSPLPRNHSSRAVDVIRSHLVGRLRRLRSRSWAAKLLQAGFLTEQQVASAGPREVPVAPIIPLEPSHLLAKSHADGALLTCVKKRERLEEDRHGVGAEGCRVPTVERALGARTRQVRANDEGVGIDEMQGAQHGEPLNERPERKAAALPPQRCQREPGERAREIDHESRRVEPDFRQSERADVQAHARERGRHYHREQRSEEHTSELQSLAYLVCRLLL